MKVLQFAIRQSNDGKEFNTAYLKDGLIERAFNEREGLGGDDGAAKDITLESVAEFIGEEISGDARVITITVEIANDADLKKKDEK